MDGTNSNLTSSDNNKITRNLLFAVIGIIAIGIICVFIEVCNNKLGTGLYISFIVVVCGLTLYSILILFTSYNKKIDDKSNTLIRSLLTVNSLINIAALIYFIIIISNKKSDLSNINVIEYIQPYLQKFVTTVVVITILIIIINHSLVRYAILKKHHVLPTIIFLSFFGLCEGIIEVILLNIINISLNRVTDG
jgi:hypothetical protein